MLTWDEEVKPTPPLFLSRDPQAGRSVESPSRLPEARVLDDGASVPRAAAPSAQTTPHRVKASDKRIINGKTDVNQLVPFKSQWAWAQ